MRQERKAETGEYQHNDAERRVWIFDRRYLFPRLFRSPVCIEKVSHASALPFQLRFGSDCSFTCSFGKGEPAWQRDFVNR